MSTPKSNIFIIVIFVVCLYLPLIDAAFNIDPSPEIKENRASTSISSLAEGKIEEFPTRFESYYNDHLGFRDSLIHWHNYVKVFIFNMAPSGLYDIPDAIGGEASRLGGDNAVVGQDGWLYLAGYDNRAIADYRGIVPLSPQELERWKARLLERRDWLKARNIEYMFVIIPDKQSIYPEYYPDVVTRDSEHPRMGQLIQYLSSETNLNILDLRPALFEGKKKERIYHKTDTHWNDIGAHIGYQEIIQGLNPWFPKLAPRQRSQFELKSKLTPGRDLARFLALTNKYEEEYIQLAPKTPLRAKRTQQDVIIVNKKRPEFFQPFAYQTGNTTLPRALMLRDSFSTALIPFLSENFEYIAYYWPRFGRSGQDPLSPDIIESANPDVVIEEWVERDLLHLIPENRLPRNRKGYTKKVSNRPEKLLFDLTKMSNFDLLNTNDQLDIAFEEVEGEIQAHLKVTGSTPILFLPKIKFPQSRPVFIELDLTSPVDTTTEMYYKLFKIPNYTLKYGARKAIPAGRNTVVYSIEDQELYGRIRIDIGRVPGDYTIHSLRIFVK